MTKYRKQILLAVLGAILLFYAGDWLLGSLLRGPLEAREAKTAKLQRDIEKHENRLAKARKAAKQLAAWESRSLPSDVEVARSLYQAWLLELVKYVDLANPNVDSGEPAGRKGMYHVLTFSVRGRGTLDQLTWFLFEFYSADHLHQIRSLGITPLERSGGMDLSISIEALALPRADRKDRLGAGRSDRLASGRLEDYRVVVRRNLFAMGSGTDETDHAYLTAVNSVDGQPEAWFSLRTKDRVLKLRVGQELAVGTFHGAVRQIAGTEVVLESDGQRWLLTVGDNLGQAFALPPGL